MAETPHVELRGIGKRFGATVALDGIDLRIERGTVHALVGENGAGKSTLGKLLAGVTEPDTGELFIDGSPVTLRSPRQALEHGCTIVAQELSLVPGRSVVENVFLGFEEHWGPVVRRRRLQRAYTELVTDTGIHVPARRAVKNLPVAEQQKVEILRALARRARLVVMDEPTARLTADEAAVLRATVRRLAAAGTTVLYVSHFLDEVLQVADTVTVMRDGSLVSTAPVREHSRETLIRAMIGRDLDSTFPAKRGVAADARTVLRVRGLTRPGAFTDVSFEVRAGEVVVLAGLVGSGRSEVVRAVYAADRIRAGEVMLQGKVLRIRNPRQAIAAGIAMIPESRKSQGLQLTQSVERNVTLPHLVGLSRWGVVRTGAERRQAARASASVGVKAAAMSAPVSTLSGGNQQKVLFARSLLNAPALLIADEPTRGVDVAAKRAIYDLIAELASSGAAILLVSSELEEVLGLADRVVVMREGRVAAILTGAEITEHVITRAAFGVAADAVPETVAAAARRTA